MRHYIAYHNPVRMNGPYKRQRDAAFFTSRNVLNAQGSWAWVLTYTTKKPKPDFSIASVFEITHVDPSPRKDFRYCIKGNAFDFHPLVPIRQEKWFPSMMRKLANFSVGFQRINDPEIIAGLELLARKAGWKG